MSSSFGIMIPDTSCVSVGLCRTECARARSVFGLFDNLSMWVVLFHAIVAIGSKPPSCRQQSQNLQLKTAPFI